jgi:hypothetical protein
MNNLEESKQVLIKAREQIINEINTCARNGAVGRVSSYAPVLTNLHNAIKVFDELMFVAEPKPVEQRVEQQEQQVTRGPGRKPAQA